MNKGESTYNKLVKRGQIDEWMNNESAYQSTGDSKKYGREEEEEAWMNFTVKLSWQKLGNNIITRFKFLV